ncbi:MAG: uncharacterized protein A8A55_2488 [Amphiamblys sp. WSBS2006]|nr:MAG: uncharacterized protein A8A55_2488 [Amphiamblys sp. WSBS2006]
METGAIALKHKSMFFVFMDKSLFLVPEEEYKHFKHDKEGYTCLKKKHLPYAASRDTERVICIVCHGETELEDLVSPLCREIHFVLCRECVKYLKKRTDSREVACPYCRGKQDDKAFQEEIIGVLFSLIPHQTLTSLELRPDMEVETVTKLTRETKVVLSNITVTAPLFFRLLEKTNVEIRNMISLVVNDSSYDWSTWEFDWCTWEFDWYTTGELDWCIRELGCETDGRTTVSVYGCNEEEIKWICANTRTEESRTLSPWKIRGDESNVCTFLKYWGGVSENNRYNNISLGLSNKEPTKDILGEGNSSIWVGKVRRLKLSEYAIGILAKLRIHEESVVEDLVLDAYSPEHIAEILKMENSSIWIGKVRRLDLKHYAVEILPKLKLHEEKEMGELFLYAKYPEHITKIIKAENSSIWVGKVKRLELKDYAVEILPKLRIHEENVMENFYLDLYGPEYITEILRVENNSIWVGKVKRLELKHYAVEILSKLRIPKDNVIEEFVLDVYRPEYLTEILKMEKNSIWVGKLKRLVLKRYAIEIRSKLRIPEDNVIEEFVLGPCGFKHLTEIFKEKDNSIWVGKVKNITCDGKCAEKVKAKLDFTLIAPGEHEENGGD